MNALSATAAAAAALILTAGTSSAIDYNPPFDPVATIGGQAPLIYPNSPVELLVTEGQSGGQFGMVVTYTKPGDGPGENELLEQKLTETYYVIEGQYRFFVGNDTYEGGPGTVVVNPPKVPHSFKSIGTGIGKLMIVYTPVEPGPMKGTDFFVQWAKQSTRTPEWIAMTNAEYGIDRPAP